MMGGKLISFDIPALISTTQVPQSGQRLIPEQRFMKQVILTQCLLTIGLFLSPTIACAEVLKAEVSLSESLPQVPSAAMPGQQYSASAVKDSFRYIDDWRRVPSWKAGYFHSEMEVQQTTDGIKQMVTRSGSHYGDMRDAHGHYWELIAVPRPGLEVDEVGTFQHNWVISDESVEIGPSISSAKCRYISIVVDKSTGTIVRTVQQEDLNTAIPNDETSYKLLSRRRVFTPDGKFIMDITSTRICYRTGQFLPNMQLVNSFRNYLLAQGRSDLLPADLSVGVGQPSQQ
jgi:hypothetical protein